MGHKSNAATCFHRRRWRTTRPPSAAWPSSSSTCTGRRWSCSRAWREGPRLFCRPARCSGARQQPLSPSQKAGEDGVAPARRRVTTALNKTSSSSSFRSWPRQPWFLFPPWLPAAEQPCLGRAVGSCLPCVAFTEGRPVPFQLAPASPDAPLRWWPLPLPAQCPCPPVMLVPAARTAASSLATPQRAGSSPLPERDCPSCPSLS